MDERLLRRVQALGAGLVCISYFLPWVSIITPLGSVEVRGLYVDFAWLLFVGAMIHLLLQFARLNKTALGLPDETADALDFAWKGIPFLLIAFLAWYATEFAFRDTTSGAGITIFGVSLESVIRAGLDYGFWIGTLGSVVLLFSVGILSHDIKKFASYGAIAAILVAMAGVGVTKSGVLGHPNIPPPLVADVGTTAPSAPAPVNPPAPVLNAAPYVTITKITGRNEPKDITADRFSDTIWISSMFKNVGTKTIVGLQGHIAMIDGFGKEVYGFNFRDDDKLLPGQESGGEYKFEGNQFEDNDPYHKMLPLLEGGTAKYGWSISRIAFDDGTVLPK